MQKNIVMHRLGERIRKKREQLHLHLNELAEKVGVSSSALSQIENSKSFPSVVTLKSIADSLHTSIGELVGEHESLASQPVVYKDEVKFHSENGAGAMVFSLSNPDVSKQMDTFLIRLDSDAKLDGVVTNKVGQVFCHVLSGELLVELNNKPYDLKCGDNLYFNARASFSAANATKGFAELLWIQTPSGL